MNTKYIENIVNTENTENTENTKLKQPLIQIGVKKDIRIKLNKLKFEISEEAKTYSDVIKELINSYEGQEKKKDSVNKCQKTLI